MTYSELKAGVGRREVTPPLGVQLYGYPIRDRKAESIADPLNSTALVLARNGVTAAIISLDWIMIDNDDLEMIRNLVHERTGIPPENVTVCAIQTHTAPSTMSAHGWGDKDTEYVNSMIPRIVDSVVEAHAALQPARVGIGTTYSEVGINRRNITEEGEVGLGYNPWGLFDPTMTVLRFESESGPLATIVHYGAHPTSIGPEKIVSRDWPGVMVDRVEKITGAPALFINGAVGDIAPRTNIHSATGDGLTAAIEVGYRAGLDALRAYHEIKDFRDLELSVLTDETPLPYAPLPAKEEAEREMAALEADKDNWGAPQANYMHWKTVVQAHDEPPVEALPFQQTITRLGPIVIIPFPGEPFAEIILRLRERSPFAYTLCASTTNGVNGYFVTRDSRARGGYEVWVARAFGAHIFADDIDDVLVRENLRLLRSMNDGSNKSNL